MRVVLDPNVLVSALLSRSGAPAQILRRWLAGEFEVIASSLLLGELERTLAYSKIRKKVTEADAAAFVALIRENAHVAADPEERPARSPDPGDDYLLALAETERAIVISGDAHVLGMADRYPVRSPRAFLED